MEWTNRDMLKRIAALLFAFAALADRASPASPSVRTQLLAILRQAEAVGYAFVAATARDLGVVLPRACFDGNDPDDATRLAFRLRVLALVLVNLSARAECSASLGSGRIVATIEVPRKPGQLTDCRGKNTSTPDTS